jgi:hypothetical protein
MKLTLTHEEMSAYRVLVSSIALSENGTVING